jgi:hypothetical protein
MVPGPSTKFMETWGAIHKNPLDSANPQCGLRVISRKCGVSLGKRPPKGYAKNRAARLETEGKD